MEQVKNKINATEAITRMVRAINMNDQKGFYHLAERYMNSFSENGQVHQELKRVLRNRPMNLRGIQGLRSETKKLVEIIQPKQELIYLNEDRKAFVDDFIKEIEHREELIEHNVFPRHKLLLHGESGNGKNTLVKHLSFLTQLPIIQVNSDLVVDSKVGATGGNINEIFSNVNFPCILFWDEIDSVMSKRGIFDNSAATQENNRMVNSLLIHMENLPSEVIFIGSTNRYDVIDSAFHRRFDETIEIGEPSFEEKEEFSEKMRKHYKLPDNYYIALVGESEKYKNFAEIKKAYLNLVREYVLNKNKKWHVDK